jgi:hypothetical protein
MSGVWSTIGWIVAGGVGWFATAFVGSPIRRFYDLRGEVIQRSVMYANVMAVQKEFPDGSVTPNELSEDETKRLREAVDVFRDLAARMRAFALNERLAVWFVKRWGYDPWEASEALFWVSHTLPTYGGKRADAKKTLEKALRFRVEKESPAVD